MTSHEIRKAFLDFFRSKQHLIVASAPLVAKNDPTLMFNNSGMAQFKDFFLGNGNPPSKRIADTQKCLRVSGKHNDLEDVGFDTYHHTMFEMLGNWSFGDYFKKDALEWSWELLTEVYKLPKDRIYVSVFGGDEKDGVPFDQEAWDIWKGIIGDENRIILGNKKDNFWEMGDTGPCGPCSEIHIDLRDQAEVDKIGGKELVNNDHPQVVEIWNNVFMQFERKADGSLLPLPSKHVDTGMGFERLCMAIQGKKSNYDTDIFMNTITVIEKMSGLKYGVNGTLTADSYVDVAMRVIADHLRAVSFAIADGQMPSNAKAGYVIRRILRRAIRYGFSYLNFKEPFMCRLVPVLAEQFKDVFPELQAQVDFVTKVIEEEEKSFLRTLETGIKRFDEISNSIQDSVQILQERIKHLPIEKITQAIQNSRYEEIARNFTENIKGIDFNKLNNFGNNLQETFEKMKPSFEQLKDRLENTSEIYKQFGEQISNRFREINGKLVFELSDTYGFPSDLTALIAKEKGFKIDEAGFEKALAEQKARSRADSAKEATDWIELIEGNDFEFVGYNEVSCEAQIIKYKKVKTKTGEEYHIVLDRTPFYAEMGGQVGDSGYLEFNVEGSKLKVKINDTKKENDLFIHISTDKNFEKLSTYNLQLSTVTAHIDESRRRNIMRNHTATHLMLSAFRNVLGNHIIQKGSYQNEEVTRFDFSHFSKVTDEELAKVEEIVNNKIRENIALEYRVNVPIADAINMGATATFGEKYGDFVRVVVFDPKFSVELCGGTHVPATGEIGIFKFVSEGSVSAGVRRVEAVTGEKAVSIINEQLAINNNLKEILKSTDLIKSVNTLLSEKSALQKRIEALEGEKITQLRDELAKKVQSIREVNVVAAKVDVPSVDALKTLAYQLKDKLSYAYIILGAEIGGKPNLAICIDETVIKSHNLNAGTIIREIAKEIKGGGGGQPHFATAGGSDTSGLDRAINLAVSNFEK